MQRTNGALSGRRARRSASRAQSLNPIAEPSEALLLSRTDHGGDIDAAIRGMRLDARQRGKALALGPEIVVSWALSVLP